MKILHVSLVTAFLFLIASYVFSADEGLVGYWNFDEGKGDVASDSSGNKSQ